MGSIVDCFSPLPSGPVSKGKSFQTFREPIMKIANTLCQAILLAFAALAMLRSADASYLRAVASGPSGPADSDIVPVNKLEKDVAAQDKLADDAAKKLRADKEKLKAAKADLAQQLTEAANAADQTHGAAEDALDPKFGKLLNGSVVETKEAKAALELVKKLSKNMTLEQLDAMSLKKRTPSSETRSWHVAL